MRRARAIRPSLSLVTVLLLSLSVGGCVVISGTVDPFSREPEPLREHVVSGTGEAKILLVDISGKITNEEERGTFGIGKQPSMVARIESELSLAEQDENVRGVIVRINSPGGTVTASDILYDRLSRFRRERGVPVVAQLMDIAASGGYYVALASDEIIAHPTTVTGSIGVIFTGVSVAGLLDKIGVENQTIKTGSKKDIGTPLRTMTPAERELLEVLLGDMQDRFLSVVEERRPSLTPQMKELVSDGRVMSARQAFDAGLVDRIGYLDDAIEVTKSRAGISEARVILYRRPNEFAENVYSHAGIPAVELNLVNLDLASMFTTPQFLYLWMP